MDIAEHYDTETVSGVNQWDVIEKGLRCSESVPYGYRRDPEDKQHFIVDEEAAAVVRRIFQMVIEG